MRRDRPEGVPLARGTGPTERDARSRFPRGASPARRPVVSGSVDADRFLLAAHRRLLDEPFVAEEDDERLLVDRDES